MHAGILHTVENCTYHIRCIITLFRIWHCVSSLNVYGTELLTTGKHLTTGHFQNNLFLHIIFKSQRKSKNLNYNRNVTLIAKYIAVDDSENILSETTPLNIIAICLTEWDFRSSSPIHWIWYTFNELFSIAIRLLTTVNTCTYCLWHCKVVLNKTGERSH